MKKAITFRFDEAPLADARRCAVQENRTLTNFIETLVKTHIASRSDEGAIMADEFVVLSPAPPIL